MIQDLFPAVVAAEDSFVDTPVALLLPAEQAVVARAVPKRRQEFATVRHCARRALARLGVDGGAILPGERGAPGWPAGIVGSMTHCPGYRAAAVARHTDVGAIGVDAEPNEPLPDGVLPLVASPAERDRLADDGRRRPDVCWDRLLFSAKESVYKTWFPLAGRFLGFEEAEIEVDAERGRFVATLLVGPSAPVRRLVGRFLIARGLIVTAIVHP
jgi:4'-phosphopantetheinyl transferase EntD